MKLSALGMLLSQEDKMHMHMTLEVAQTFLYKSVIKHFSSLLLNL